MVLKTGRGGDIPPFRVMDVIAAANAHAARLGPHDPRVIRMEVGQPALGAPQGAVEAAMAALRSGHALGYTEAFGLPNLRHRIARHYAEWYGTVVDTARIAVTTGASGAFPLAFLSAFDPGDRVALAAPYYPPYVNKADEPGGGYWNIEPEPRARLLAALQRGGVKILLTGHLHYQATNHYEGMLIETTAAVSFGIPHPLAPEGWTLVTMQPKGDPKIEFHRVQ